MPVEHAVIIIGKAPCQALLGRGTVLQKPADKERRGAAGNKGEGPAEDLLLALRQALVDLGKKYLVKADLHRGIGLPVKNELEQRLVLPHVSQVQKRDLIKIVHRQGGDIRLRVEDRRGLVQKFPLEDKKFLDDLPVQVVDVGIIGVKGGAVDVRFVAKLLNRDLMEVLLPHQFKERVPDDLF